MHRRSRLPPDLLKKYVSKTKKYRLTKVVPYQGGACPTEMSRRLRQRRCAVHTLRLSPHPTERPPIIKVSCEPPTLAEKCENGRKPTIRVGPAPLPPIGSCKSATRWARGSSVRHRVRAAPSGPRRHQQRHHQHDDWDHHEQFDECEGLPSDPRSEIEDPELLSHRACFLPSKHTRFYLSYTGIVKEGLGPHSSSVCRC